MSSYRQTLSPDREVKLAKPQNAAGHTVSALPDNCR